MRKCNYVIFCATLFVCVSFLNADHSFAGDGNVRAKIPHRHRQFIPFFVPYADAINGSNNSCSSDDDFPDFLPKDQLKHGGVILVILIGVYGFSLLAVVCDKYFLPCVETICEVVGLSPDVAAATFMSIATSTPELFTNIIGTFITKSDIGIGTIVGSSLFNGLGVAAIGSLAAPYPLQLDWWPITRDCCLYAFSVSALVIITWDGSIFWYEALVLMIIYCIYFVIMFQNRRIAKFIKRKFNKNQVDIGSQPEQQQPEPIVLESRLSIISAYGTYLDEVNKPGYIQEHIKTLEKIEQEDIEEAARSLFRKPEGSKLHKIVFYYTWPIQIVLRYSIPNPKIHPKLFPITFVMCIAWIGVNSYVVAWMISLIGDLVGLSDAVMGMTLLAAGSSLPESISMAIIARRGEGAFGVSNSLGANTMNILYSLGMPWFIKNMVNGATKAHPVVIQSGSIEYTILSLIFVAACLFTTIACNGFRLSKRTGAVLITIYVCMVVLAILMETPLQLDWWPITRDCCLYAFSVSALVIITWDGSIFWYEALVLMIIYCIYFVIMFQNRRIAKFIKRKFNKNQVDIGSQPEQQQPEPIVLESRLSIISAYGTYLDEVNKPGYIQEHIKTLEKIEQEDIEEAARSLFRKPEGSKLHKIVFYYTWPIQIVLRYSIPNPKIHPKLFPITFVMCIAWIGVNSYVVAWMISLIGDLVGLSDAVMGMTLLAAGSSLPESISMAIIARRGEGAFGVSNSLGANTMNILYSLGMPWFIKNMVNGATTAHPVVIQSGSIEYTILSLIFVAACLFTTIACNGFRLSKRTGAVLITIYVCMVVLAILMETVFFDNSRDC